MADISLYVGIGRLTRDAEVKNVPSGKTVTQFTLASNPSWNRDDPALFMDCQMWGERGAKVAGYLRKGVKACVQGTLKQETWIGTDGQKKSRFRVDVNDVNLIESRKDESPAFPQGDQDMAHAGLDITSRQIAAVFGVRKEEVKPPIGSLATVIAINDGFEDDIPF
jgi:single-strand DNA-binding protein